MEDKDLVERAQRGEKDAFGLLYQKYFQKIFRYCKINLKNEELAKDICQESFVKAYKKLKDFKTDGQWSIQAFLFTIARNLIIDHSRRKKEASIEDYENLQSMEDPYEDSERRENIQKIRTVLSKLEEVDRQIVILRYFEEMPSLEVAKILGIKDGALRVRTFRVMQKVKDIYESLYGQKN
ncbi:MAG: RNA polymerase sigma factor [Candidatus Levybacteria bacterium]|nr:RNA polymerase sigma factor [Candidatus Levybacteria bacterium]